MTPAEHRAEIEAWRRRRIERLTADDGWLSLAALQWLAEGENAVEGGVIEIRNGAATFVPTPGQAVAADGRPRSGPFPLRADSADEPTRVSAGSRRLELLERGGRFALRVRETGGSARGEFRGIENFPVDPAWRFDARFEPYDPPKQIPMTSVVGTVERERSPGAVAFEIGGATHRLDPIFERGESDYWIVFGDRTNGVDTYGGGRFVYVAPPVGGRTVLDFNKAYNPPCVFTPYSTCPLPPPQNRLPFRVEAGEKTYR